MTHVGGGVCVFFSCASSDIGLQSLLKMMSNQHSHSHECQNISAGLIMASVIEVQSLQECTSHNKMPKQNVSPVLHSPVAVHKHTFGVGGSFSGKPFG